MGYAIRKKDASPGDAARRIAGEQIGKAIASIDKLCRAEAIHDVRKRCKKLRALVRLVRPGFADYAEENAALRDTASLISLARDAKVMQETYDTLMKASGKHVDRKALASIRRRFTFDCKASASGLQDDCNDDALAEVRSRLEAAGQRAENWHVEGEGWDVLGKGLRKSYAKARKACEAAAASPKPDEFHEMRKRIKYHWYHCRLLAKVWPEMLGVRIAATRELAELLGDHHDLAVFEGKLSAEPDRYGKPDAVATACDLAASRRKALEVEAWPLAERLLAQSPGALEAEFGAMWDTWRADAPVREWRRAD